MIYGILHQGSGLGNQLHRYVATRVRATDLGVDFGFEYNPDGSGKEEGFKGKSFMNVDLGRPMEGAMFTWNEKRVDNENGVDIRPYDERFTEIPDGTIIDGEFQDEKYWEHRADEVAEWLAVELLDVSECVIGFRGGEYQYYPDLFLPITYWNNAIQHIRELEPDIKFRVVTDDIPLAQAFFPNYEITHDVGHDWRSVRYAKYAIIANSSFYILPRWLRHKEGSSLTIAPMYWARHNLGFWALPQNIYKDFHYLDTNGDLHAGNNLKL